MGKPRNRERAVEPMDDGPRRQAEGHDHSDMIFVAVIALVIVALGFIAFLLVVRNYTTYFTSPGEQAAKAVAEAASSAAEGVPSTAIADAKAAWGQFGDYLGGMLNPLLSFFSFIALSLALLLQARQVGISRTELRETRKERVDAQADAKAQLKAARSLALAQVRTARAQERAAQLLAKQLEEASATARAQEKAAQALMLHARITTLTTQLNQATSEHFNLETAIHRAKLQIGTHPAVIEAMVDKLNLLAMDIERHKEGIVALEEQGRLKV